MSEVREICHKLRRQGLQQALWIACPNQLPMPILASRVPLLFTLVDSFEEPRRFSLKLLVDSSSISRTGPGCHASFNDKDRQGYGIPGPAHLLSGEMPHPWLLEAYREQGE